MAAFHSQKVSDVEWLYPDLLSEEGLIHILKQRHIKDTNGRQLLSLDKESLVELYNQYILPKPQRKYPNNRRGREMTKRQILHMKKRKITMTGDSEISNKRSKFSSSNDACDSRRGIVNHSSNHSSSNSLGDRLKPPPSCINFDKKVVKLGSSSKSSASSTASSATSSTKMSLARDNGVSKVKRSLTDDTDVTKSKKAKLETNTASSSPSKTFSKITWP